MELDNKNFARQEGDNPVCFIETKRIVRDSTPVYNGGKDTIGQIVDRVLKEQRNTGNGIMIGVAVNFPVDF